MIMSTVALWCALFGMTFTWNGISAATCAVGEDPAPPASSAMLTSLQTAQAAEAGLPSGFEVQQEQGGVAAASS